MSEMDDVFAAIGAPYGMSATDLAAYLVLGDRQHGDAPTGVCGAVDPRDETRWCVLAPEHRGEDHNCYAPSDGCRTWTEHDSHEAPK